MSSCNDPCADNISIIVDTGSRGQPGPPGPAAKVLEWTFYLNPGDTIISGDDASAKPLAYTPDSVQVYLNGVQLSKRDDYTTDEDGLSIVLNEAIVNANDIMVIVSQVPPENYDPTNDNNRLQGQIDDNKEAIEGLDVRVTANETAIENLEGLADGFTTRDVKLSGVNTTRSVDEPLETQQNLNVHFDGLIAANEERIDAIEGGQPDLTSDIEDLREDVDSNTGSINDNALAIGKLADVVEQNVTDIGKLDSQIKALPDPYDDTELKGDVDDIAKSVASNTVAISKNTADIAALDEPVDLDPLNAAIATNAAGINQNAKDIVSLKATDATLTGQVNDLEAAVGDLEAIDIPEDIAFTNVDNAFETAQTIKSGLKITGADAFIEMDKGTALTVSNNNAYQSVIEIERSSGDVSLQLQADGQIRGVKTDGADDTSAVSVGWFQDNVGAGGGDVDLSAYATKVELKTEEVARIQGDELLAKELEEAITTQRYDDTQVRNLISQEEKARESADDTLRKNLQNETKYRTEADSSLQDQIDALEIPAVDPDLYATLVAMEKGDADTLAAANTFTTEAIAAIEFPELPEGLATEAYVDEAIAAIPEVSLDGYATEEFVTDAIEAIEFPAGTILSDDAPIDATDGDYWFDTNRLELFIYYQDAWITTTPLGARIDEGEAIQRAIIEQVNDSVDKQDNLVQTVNDRARVQDALVVSTKLLSDKVDALEGSTLDAKYKADPRDNPQTGAFVLQDAEGNKVLKFSAAEKIELSKTDFTNKVVDISKVMNGDIIRLVLSASNYGNFTIASVETGDETFTLGLTFGSAGSEEIVFDGMVYDFTHATPFDPGAAATIDYVDAQVETKLSKSGDTMSGVLNMGDNYIANLKDPGSGTDAVNRNYVTGGFLSKSGEQILTSSAWKIRAPTTDPDDNGKLSFIDIKENELHLYHVADPTDARHGVPKVYLEENYAGKGTANTFRETQTFQKSSYFQNGVIFNGRNGATAIEVRGENETLSDIWCKVRGTNRLSFICYPGQDNVGYKRVIQMNWNDEKDNPELKLSYLVDPTGNGDAANKRYVDQEIAKVAGGSGATANSGTTTPTLATGEMFFNTTSKILFIGDS